MAEYIEREAALASIRERCAPCGEGIEVLKASPPPTWPRCGTVNSCFVTKGMGIIGSVLRVTQTLVFM